MMNPKNIKPAVPKYRFKGAYDKDGNWIAFTDPWEQRKLGDIITEYKETVDSDCTLPILTSSKTEGVILQEEHFGRKQQHDITGYNILPRNYCTYRNRSDGVDFTFNINKCCDKGIISKFYPVFSGKNSDVFFLSLVLNNSEEVVREIAYTCTGTGQKVLSFLDLQKMKVRVPNFDEQKEIAAYFESLDHIITLVERKCENYRKAKQAMMQKLFSQEVRFTADDGSEFPEWEEKAIWEITTWDKKFNEVEKYKQQSVIKYPYVLADTLKNMKDNKGSVKLLSTGTYMDYTTEKKAGKNLCEGEIIAIPWGGEPNIKYHKGKFVTSDNRIAQAADTQTTNLKWLAYCMSSKMTEIKSYYRGASIKHPSMKAILDMHITIPSSIEEQTKIADCLSKYDDLITATENKLTAYRQLKKCMLQNMFA